MEEFRKEIMCFVKYDDHVAEHKAINEMFNVDCDNLPVEKHLALHLEYKYKIGELSEDQYSRYKNENL